jgi:hypothetical protein
MNPQWCALSQELGVAEQEERRREPRHRAHLAAEIILDEGVTRPAVTKNISNSGVMVLTGARLKDGQIVSLKIHRPGDESSPLVRSGRVVRRQPLNAEEIGTWWERVAFEFHEPEPELTEELAVLAERRGRRS